MREEKPTKEQLHNTARKSGLSYTLTGEYRVPKSGEWWWMWHQDDHGGDCGEAYSSPCRSECWIVVVEILELADHERWSRIGDIPVGALWRDTTKSSTPKVIVDPYEIMGRIACGLGFDGIEWCPTFHEALCGGWRPCTVPSLYGIK